VKRPSDRLHQLAAKLNRAAVAIASAPTAPTCPAAVEQLLQALEGDAALLAHALTQPAVPAPRRPRRYL
jgi:hypothetical protein